MAVKYQYIQETFFLEAYQLSSSQIFFLRFGNNTYQIVRLYRIDKKPKQLPVNSVLSYESISCKESRLDLILAIFSIKNELNLSGRHSGGVSVSKIRLLCLPVILLKTEKSCFELLDEEICSLIYFFF